MSDVQGFVDAAGRNSGAIKSVAQRVHALEDLVLILAREAGWPMHRIQRVLGWSQTMVRERCRDLGV